MQAFGEIMRNTAWENPTKNTVKARIFTGPDGGFKVFVVPPGEVRELPSEYDAAIQSVRGGRVVSGMAPQLRRVGKSNPPLDPALDAEAAAAKARELEIQKAVTAKAAADLAVEKATTAEARALTESTPKHDETKRSSRKQ
jgi:hypothetical protein